MAATEFLCNLVGVKPYKLSREENIIIEAELFSRICEHLYKHFEEKHSQYFKMIKFDKDKEIKMLEHSFSRCVINDILATGEYTLSGIAYYTETPEEIIVEIVSGNITNPSVIFFRKIIELHRNVRSDLYQAIMKKILNEYHDFSPHKTANKIMSKEF